MAITKKETFIAEEQAVRVVLRNELGHIVHDLKLPLVVTIGGEHQPFDVDKVVDEHIAMHEKRHQVFMEAAVKRGHIVATPDHVVATSEKDCGCK